MSDGKIQRQTIAALFTRPLHLCYKPTIRSDRNPLPHESPPSEYAQQNKRFALAFQMMEDATRDHAFPACSLAVTHQGSLVALKSVGHFTYDPASVALTDANLFDIASVSKVVATTTMAMILYERGMLDLDVPVTSIVPEFANSEDSRRHDVSIRMLLAHSSGLPAYAKLFMNANSPEALLDAVFTTELTADPDARAEYSDIGFIILGVALARLADESLEQFCRREIFGPLAMVSTTYNPASALRSNSVPTADDQSFRHRVIQGEVQDENASVLGGIAGHAGLFSTAADIARFAMAMLQGGQPILRPETLAVFTKRQALPAGTSRALGWDTPSQPSQSGRYLSPQAFGHLGYTGTSLWIDPERELSITLLTNRTWPDCKNQAIREVRPRLNDAIVEALEK